MHAPPSPPSISDFLTVSEAAEVLGVTAGTLRYWDRTGKLKPVRHPLNGYRLYRREDLDALLRQFSPVAAAGDQQRGQR